MQKCLHYRWKVSFDRFFCEAIAAHVSVASFTSEALPKITDGSIPDPPIDPVLEELEENEQQMQEAPERDDVRSAEIPELLDDSVFIEGPNQESGAGISIPKAGTQVGLQRI